MEAGQVSVSVCRPYKLAALQFACGLCVCYTLCSKERLAWKCSCASKPKSCLCVCYSSNQCVMSLGMLTCPMGGAQRTDVIGWIVIPVVEFRTHQAPPPFHLHPPSAHLLQHASTSPPSVLIHTWWIHLHLQTHIHRHLPLIPLLLIIILPLWCLDCASERMCRGRVKDV